MNPLISGALAAVVGALAVEAHAEPAAPHPLDQVTVTADRLTASAPGEAAARAAAERVPGGANVVGQSEYADGRASTLVDVFAFTPGDQPAIVPPSVANRNRAAPLLPF